MIVDVAPRVGVGMEAVLEADPDPDGAMLPLKRRSRELAPTYAPTVVPNEVISTHCCDTTSQIERSRDKISIMTV